MSQLFKDYRHKISDSSSHHHDSPFLKSFLPMVSHCNPQKSVHNNQDRNFTSLAADDKSDAFRVAGATEISSNDRPTNINNQCFHWQFSNSLLVSGSPKAPLKADYLPPHVLWGWFGSVSAAKGLPWWHGCLIILSNFCGSNLVLGKNKEDGDTTERN
jgi:hypothetical protein